METDLHGALQGWPASQGMWVSGGGKKQTLLKFESRAQLSSAWESLLVLGFIFSLLLPAFLASSTP